MRQYKNLRKSVSNLCINCMQVEMTTGATIHTTEGLKMTVTRRIKPPIMPVLKEDAADAAPIATSKSDADADAPCSKTNEISPAHSKLL